MKRIVVTTCLWMMCMACTVDVRIDRGPGADAMRFADGAEVNDAGPIQDGALSPSDASLPEDADQGPFDAAGS